MTVDVIASTLFSVRLSTRSRYGLRALYELAQHYGNGPLMAQTIADRQNVSRKYLDSIFANLRTAGLVRSRRGAGGGHELAKAPKEITIGDVIRTLEGYPLLLECVNDVGVCPRSAECIARDLWSELEQSINEVLDGLSLSDLVDRQARCTG